MIYCSVKGKQGRGEMEKECIFCKIINGQLPADFLYEDDDLVVFKDKYPQAPVHLLIVPKKHIRSVNDMMPDDRDIVGKMIFTGREMAKKHEIDLSGYRLLMNVEKGGGQLIFHIHLHLLGGWKR